MNCKNTVPIIKTYVNVCEANERKYRVVHVNTVEISIFALNFASKNGNKTKHCTETVRSEKACIADANLEANINEPKMKML